jgi:hypothetical protein
MTFLLEIRKQEEETPFLIILRFLLFCEQNVGFCSLFFLKKKILKKDLKKI